MSTSKNQKKKSGKPGTVKRWPTPKRSRSVGGIRRFAMDEPRAEVTPQPAILINPAFERGHRLANEFRGAFDTSELKDGLDGFLSAMRLGLKEELSKLDTNAEMVSAAADLVGER